MYSDLYNTFENKNIPYYESYNFKDNRAEYMKSNNEPTYEFTKGDTLVIPFKVACCYSESYINIIVYNFRYEEIYCESLMPDENNQVYLNISEEVSNKYFKKGHYFVQLQTESLVDNLVQIHTIMPAEDCIIYVR